MFEAHSHFVVLEGEVVWLLTGHGDSGHSGAGLLAAEPPGHLCVVLWRGHVGAISAPRLGSVPGLSRGFAQLLTILEMVFGVFQRTPGQPKCWHGLQEAHKIAFHHKLRVDG